MPAKCKEPADLEADWILKKIISADGDVEVKAMLCVDRSRVASQLFNTHILT